MKIHEVALTTHHLDAMATFFREVLQMPVNEHAGQATVTIGSSDLHLMHGQEFNGVHHLAFGISPQEFNLARTWLSRRVNLITVEGSEVIDGPDGWNAQSLYFHGPEGIILEFIARQADAEIPGSSRTAPRPLSISEVGIGVPDVGTAVRELTDKLGVPKFPPHAEDFAPVGSHDGLLIVVDQERTWFPPRTHHAARGPLKVHIDAPYPKELALTSNSTVTATATSQDYAHASR